MRTLLFLVASVCFGQTTPWSLLTLPAGVTSVRTAYAAPDGNLYIATTTGVFKTSVTSPGTNWIDITYNLPNPSTNAQKLFLTASGAILMWRGNTSASEIQRLSGTTWKQVQALPTGTQSGKYFAQSGSTIYAAYSFNLNIWKSTDDGVTWTLLFNDAYGHFGKTPGGVNLVKQIGNTIWWGGEGALAASPADFSKATFYLDTGFNRNVEDIVTDGTTLLTISRVGGSGQPVATSTDGGGTWTPRGSPEMLYFDLLSAEYSAGEKAFYVAGNRVQATGGIFQSTDGGVTWNDYNKGLDATTQAHIARVTVSPVNGAKFATTTLTTVIPYIPGTAVSGGSCDYALSGGGQVFPAPGGNGSVTITTAAGCPWVVGTPPAGVTVTSPTNGTGSATIAFKVAANAGGATSNSWTIAGQVFTIQQQASIVSALAFMGSMPHLAAEGGWNTTFTFVNKGTTSAIARTSMFAPGGSSLTLPVTMPQQPAINGSLLAASLDQSIAPNASFVMQATGPANVNYLEGSAQLQATGAPGAVDGFAIFHYDPSNQEAVVPMETRTAPSYLLAFDNTSGVRTGVALQNISNGASSIPVIIRNDAGTPIYSGILALPANGHTSFVLDDSTSGYPVTANIRGTIEFDTPSGARISALGIRYTPPGTLTTIPALANVTSAGGSMAHLASGAGWQTTLVLVNMGANAATANVKFLDDNGAPLSLPLTFPQGGSPTTASSITQNIASQASVWIQSAGPPDSSLLTGSAQLTTTGNISGFVIFRYNTNGQEAVVPLESRSASAYVLPFDNTSNTATGVAVNVVSSQNVSIPLTIRDDAGRTIQSGTIPLNANGHTSFVLADPVLGFPRTANLRGTLEFTAPASAQIGVLGIRSPPARTFTTLPALAK